MVAMVMCNVALPWLGWWHWQAGEVERLTAKLWVRWIGWWCCVGGVVSTTVVTAAQLDNGECKSKRGRVRVGIRESSNCASLYSPC